MSPNGRTLATGGDDGTVRLFDVATRTPLGVTLPGLSNTPTAPLFTPDGAFLFAVSVGGRAYRWDVRPAVMGQACLRGRRPVADARRMG